jgi:Transglutaminase-like superfamily
MLAWRAILPMLKYLVPLPRLVRLMDARHAGGSRRPDREQRITSLAERVFDRRRSGQQCLELSLVTYRYLAAVGADPRLVIAIRNDGQLAGGHAWVTVDGVPVHDSPSLLDEFASVVTFESGARGHPSEVARDAEG